MTSPFVVTVVLEKGLQGPFRGSQTAVHRGLLPGFFLRLGLECITSSAPRLHDGLVPRFFRGVGGVFPEGCGKRELTCREGSLSPSEPVSPQHSDGDMAGLRCFSLGLESGLKEQRGKPLKSQVRPLWQWELTGRTVSPCGPWAPRGPPAAPRGPARPAVAAGPCWSLDADSPSEAPVGWRATEQLPP